MFSSVSCIFILLFFPWRFLPAFKNTLVSPFSKTNIHISFITNFQPARGLLYHSLFQSNFIISNIFSVLVIAQSSVLYLFTFWSFPIWFWLKHFNEYFAQISNDLQTAKSIRPFLSFLFLEFMIHLTNSSHPQPLPGTHSSPTSTKTSSESSVTALILAFAGLQLIIDELASPLLGHAPWRQGLNFIYLYISCSWHSLW